MARLTITLSDGTEATHELGDEPLTLGRSPDNMVVIEDVSVSGHHAQITPLGPNYQLTDLGSTNGTRVNDRPITQVTMRPGDRIQFGKIEAAYLAETGGAQQPMPESPTMEVTVGRTSHRPPDFKNSSPFAAKGGDGDPIGRSILAAAALAILAFAAAVIQILTLRPPQ